MRTIHSTRPSKRSVMHEAGRRERYQPPFSLCPGPKVKRRCPRVPNMRGKYVVRKPTQVLSTNFGFKQTPNLMIDATPRLPFLAIPDVRESGNTR